MEITKVVKPFTAKFHWWCPAQRVKNKEHKNLIKLNLINKKSICIKKNQIKFIILIYVWNENANIHKLQVK